MGHGSLLTGLNIPTPVGEDGYPTFDGWRESPWHRWMMESIEVAVKASQGRYFFTPAWGNHAGDNLSSARGATQMLADIAVDSGWVRYALKEVSDYQIEVYEMLWERVEPIGLEGSVNYVRCWSPGRTAGFDCDVSCMIGVKDFQEIFLPPLVETMLTADHRLYHLDGPGALL